MTDVSSDISNANELLRKKCGLCHLEVAQHELSVYKCFVVLKPAQATNQPAFHRSSQEIPDLLIRTFPPMLCRKTDVDCDVSVLAVATDALTAFLELLHLATNAEDQSELTDLGTIRSTAKCSQ
jgi:hypothetical protein